MRINMSSRNLNYKIYMQKNIVSLNLNWGKGFVNHKFDSLTTFFLILTLFRTVAQALTIQHATVEFQQMSPRLLQQRTNTIKQYIKQVFIQYGTQEGIKLSELFQDVHDGFYVDVGAYDPIYASNTLNLYTLGWDGINVEASPQRASSFFMLRPDQTNLNLAVGQSDSFVTLYDLGDDSMSTVSSRVKQQAQKKLVKEQKVPSMSLKQICEKYFYRKPIFMNLDIEGYGSKALQGNDWSNDRCIPEVIFVEQNYLNSLSGLELPQKILTLNGYRKQSMISGANGVYIHQLVFQKYKNRMRVSKKPRQSYNIVGINEIGPAMSSHFGINTTLQLVSHHDPRTDPMFYKFAKYKQSIQLIYLQQLSRKLNPSLPNRPITILHFHPIQNSLLLAEGNFTLSQIFVGKLQYYEINVSKANQSFKVYVLNHHYQTARGAKVNVVFINQPNQPNINQKCQETKTISPVSLAYQKSASQTNDLLRSLMIEQNISGEKMKQMLELNKEALSNFTATFSNSIQMEFSQNKTHVKDQTNILTSILIIVSLVSVLLCVLICFARRILKQNWYQTYSTVRDDANIMSEDIKNVERPL